MLVVPRAAFEEVGAFNGFRRNLQDYLSAFLKPGVARYMDRDAAEGDPNFKQMVVYAIFRHGERFLTYARTKKGGEARLHDKLSMGVGGHINPVDGLTDSIHTYLAGMEREIREEITFSGTATQQLYAIINDDTNEVGRVHLGIVHLFDLDGEQVTSNEKALDGLGFHTLDELKGDLYERLETWSVICVDALSKDCK